MVKTGPEFRPVENPHIGHPQCSAVQQLVDTLQLEVSLHLLLASLQFGRLAFQFFLTPSQVVGRCSPFPRCVGCWWRRYCSRWLNCGWLRWWHTARLQQTKRSLNVFTVYMTVEKFWTNLGTVSSGSTYKRVIKSFGQFGDTLRPYEAGNAGNGYKATLQWQRWPRWSEQLRNRNGGRQPRILKFMDGDGSDHS